MYPPNMMPMMNVYGGDMGYMHGNMYYGADYNSKPAQRDDQPPSQDVTEKSDAEKISVEAPKTDDKRDKPAGYDQYSAYGYGQYGYGYSPMMANQYYGGYPQQQQGTNQGPPKDNQGDVRYARNEEGRYSGGPDRRDHRKRYDDGGRSDRYRHGGSERSSRGYHPYSRSSRDRD